MKQYLEKLQSSQTFYKNSVGNSKVAKSGHVYAKVKSDVMLASISGGTDICS